MQYLNVVGVGYAHAADGGHDAAVECLNCALNDGFGCFHYERLRGFAGWNCYYLAAGRQLLRY